MNKFITYIIQQFSSLLVGSRNNIIDETQDFSLPLGHGAIGKSTKNIFEQGTIKKPSTSPRAIIAFSHFRIFTLSHYHITAFSFLLIIATPKLIAQPGSLVTPSHNQVLLNNHVFISWNTAENATNYRVQIATDSLFNSIYTDTVVSSNSFTKTLESKRYFVHAKFYTITDSSNWVGNRSFTITNPIENPFLKVWYSADSIHLSSGKIDTLFDLSVNKIHSIQPISNQSPIRFSSSSFNNKNTILFDGINDFLTTTFPDTLTQPITYLALWEPTDMVTPSFLIDGINSTNRNAVIIQNNQIQMFSGSFCGNNEISSPKINTFIFNGSNSRFYTNSILKPICNSGPNGLSGLIIGALYDGGGYFFKGTLRELLVFKTTLCDSLRNNYELSLSNNIIPNVNLGYDIKIPYGFCNKTLNAGNGYLNYQWNTGDTTEQISINKSGTYWVQVKDIFGFQSSDTVLVNYSSFPSTINKIILCEGDTAKINLTIGSPYTYLWSNGQNTSLFSETEAGSYHVAITDTNLCVYRDTFNVIIDSLPTKLWLGNDTAICLGNPLGYQLLNYTPIDGLSGGYRYVWSTGDTTVTTAIGGTNNYALQLTNLRGCIARDTVMVTLQGIPPSTQFTVSADSICSGNTLTFTDLTIGAVSRSWVIGEGAPRTDSIYSYTYNTSGLYNIQLTTSAANGCPRTVNKTLRVNPSPTANFAIEPACIGLPTQFTNKSIPGTNDSIVQAWWDFNDPTSGIANTSILTNPQHQFSIAGIFTPQLTVSTKKGCSTTSSQILNVVSSAASPQHFTLVYPQANTLLVDSAVTFRWNESVNGFTYIFEIATNNQFTNIIFTSAPQKTNSFSYRFANFGTHYWRVTAQNICGNSSQSDIYKLNLFSPKQILGMQAWFNPDYGITSINGKITQWNDISGLNRTATQSDTSKAPNLILNKLNGHPILNFDGINDGLTIIDTLPINSLSVLSSWNGYETSFSGYRTIVSCSNPTAPETFFIGNSGTTMLFNSNYFGYNMFINGYRTPEYAPFNKIKVTSAYKSQHITFHSNKKLCIGNDEYFQSWKGWIPEIILYNNSDMDSTTLAKLNDYFYAKYAPPISLGYDIKIPYKLCDTILSATANHFTNYLWSTGETTGSISVSRSGSYWVRATNIFGQVSSDTVEVYFAAKRTLPDTTVCLGNSFQYNWTPLTNYTLSWSNGNIGSTFTETQAGTYSLMLTDTLGCTYRDTFNLYVDSLVMRMSLGNDTTLCSGNTLHFALNNYTLQNPQFIWSNGSTLSTALVSDTGNYWVQITNGLGCIARDTIHINIRGNAPVVSFTSPGKCLGIATPFSDLSYSTDVSVINNWLWNFGDGESSTVQNPTHPYTTPGIYPITLTITTDSLCSNSITIPTVVYSLPSANFSPITGCSNTQIQLTDQSVSYDGYTLSNWDWNFGDLQSGGQNVSPNQHPTHQFDTAGVYLVKFKVTSNVGCSDSLQKTVTIKSSPVANFTISNTCLGETTWFNDSSITESWNNILTRKWAFSDGYNSTQPTISKLYAAAGNYPVTYIIQSLNGCSDTVTKDAIIHPIPIANFTANNFCLNEPVILESSSTIENDIISNIRWKVGTNHIYNQSPAQFYLDSAATYPVQLIVASSYNCSDTITKTMTIKPIPTAQFTYIYDENAIGYTLQFINTSTGATSYEWSTAGTTFSNVMQPSYNFGSAGNFPILMIAKSANQCSDSASANITLIRPEIDIAVSNLTLTALGNYQQASANLINMSNRNITDLWITLQVNDQQIRERWTGMLRAGEIIPYNFRTQVYIPSGEVLNYSCIQIESPIVTEEINTANNQMCISLNNEFGILKLFPNPAHDYINLWLTSPSASEATIHIYSLSGTEISSWSNEPLQKGVTQLKFPLTNLSKSLYLLEVKFNNKVERVKFSVF